MATIVRVETETTVETNLNETEALLQRIPRNFVAAVPNTVAFDAFRNKPFHSAQVRLGRHFGLFSLSPL
jgi:hypothetical protein